MQSKTFVGGHSVRNAVTSVRHTVRRVSRNVQDSLDRRVHSGHAERPKPGRHHEISVSLGVCGQM